VTLSGRRILLAVEPAVLEGALAAMLAAGDSDDVVERGRLGHYDAAVVSDDLPAGVDADVVITLPDTRGSAGTGTVERGGVLQEVTIGGAARVVELLEEYLPPPRN
jgi:hypothetical protein